MGKSKFLYPPPLFQTSINNFARHQILSRDISLVTDPENNTPLDKIENYISEFISITYLGIKIIYRNMRNTDLLPYLSPGFFLENMEEDSLHEKHGCILLRLESRYSTKSLDSVIVA